VYCLWKLNEKLSKNLSTAHAKVKELIKEKYDVMAQNQSLVEKIAKYKEKRDNLLKENKRYEMRYFGCWVN
jgi:uncharacterized coiled-coil DUF342 family protein